MAKSGLKVISRSRKTAKDSGDLMKWWIQYNIFYNKYIYLPLGQIHLLLNKTLMEP